MWHLLILLGIVLCAVQAIRVQRLLFSALWLAGCSALVALLMFLLGAPEIAVIELSVGAGLVTVLFVFAINIAGDDVIAVRSFIPRPLALLLVGVALALLLWMAIPAFFNLQVTAAEIGLAKTLWQDRNLDLMLQVVLIFAGTLGVIGLLAQGKGQPHKEEQS